MAVIVGLGLIAGLALMLTTIAIGGWLIGIALGSVLGTLLHILAAFAFGAVMWYWIVPALSRTGFNIPKKSEKIFYGSLLFAGLFFWLALPNNGFFSIVGNTIIDAPAFILPLTTIWELMAVWAIIIYGGALVLKKLRVIK